MKPHPKTRLIQIGAGVVGTVAIIGLLTWLGGFRPPSGGKGFYYYLVGVSLLFFFPPYLAMIGVLNVRKLEEAKAGDDFMASYASANTAHSKYRRHFAAVLIGVTITLVLWVYNAVLMS